MLATVTQFAVGVPSDSFPGTTLAVDASGNTYIGGGYSGSFTLAPLPAITGGSAYVAKLSPTGRALWIKNIDSLVIADVAVDAAGTVYAAGSPAGGSTRVLNPQGLPGDTPEVLNNNGDQMALVLKFTASGAYQGRKLFTWADKFEGGSFVQVNALDLDAAGNLYLTTTYNNRLVDDGTSNFDTGNFDSDFDGSYNTLIDQLYSGSKVSRNSDATSTGVISMAPSGVVRWARGLGGSSPSTAIDLGGNLAVLEPIKIRSEFGASVFTPATGKTQAVMVRLASASGAIATASVVAEGSKTLTIGGVVVDPSEDVIVTGSYTGALKFGASAVPTAGNKNALFLTRINPSGAPVYAGGLIGSSSVSGNGLASDNRGQLFLTGSYDGKVQLGPYALTPLGQTDVFLSQIDPTNGGVFQAFGGLGVGADSVTALAMNAFGTVAFGGGVGSVSNASPSPSFGGVPLPKTGGAFVAKVQSTLPTTVVAPLPAEIHTDAIPVSWASQSLGGVAAYDVYVTVDGGPFTPWIAATTLTQAAFPGAYGHLYGFAAVAIEASGVRSVLPAAAQAATTVRSLAGTILTVGAFPARVETGSAVDLAASVVTPDTWAGTPSGSVQFLVDSQLFGAPAAVLGGVAHLATTAIPQGDHVISAIYTGPSPFLPSASGASPLSVVARVTNPGGGGTNPGGGGVPVIPVIPRHSRFPRRPGHRRGALSQASSGREAEAEQANPGDQRLLQRGAGRQFGALQAEFFAGRRGPRPPVRHQG